MEHAAGNFQSKRVSCPFSCASKYILFLAKLKGKGGPFLEDARRGTTFWDCPQEHLVVIGEEKVSPFVKFKIILPALCFLLDSLTNKHFRHGVLCKICEKIPGPVKSKESCCQQDKGLVIT